MLSIRLRLAIMALALLPAQGALAAPGRGVTDNEILVGMIAGFTSTSRELAQSMKTGIELAFAEVNAAGGVGGRKLRLIGADHGNDPAKAVALAKELVEQKNVFLLLGNVGAITIERQIPYLIEKEVVLFGTVSGGAFLYNEPPDRYVFNFRPSFIDEMQLAARHLVEVRRLKPTEIAFFGQEDSLGDSCWKGLSKALRRNRSDANRTLRTGYKRNSVDVLQAERAIRANPRIRAVVTCGTHKQVAGLIEKLHDRKLIFTALSTVEPNALADDLKPLGPDYMDGIIVTQMVPMPSSSASAVIRYRAQLAKYVPSARPDFLTLQAYLTSLVLIEGMKRTGPDLNTERLIDVLESIHDWDIGLGAPISFGPGQHTASRKIWGTVLTKEGIYQGFDLEVD